MEKTYKENNEFMNSYVIVQDYDKNKVYAYYLSSNVDGESEHINVISFKTIRDLLYNRNKVYEKLKLDYFINCTLIYSNLLGFTPNKTVAEVLKQNYDLSYCVPEKVKLQFPVSKKCDCGAEKARTTHAHWCSTQQRKE